MQHSHPGASPAEPALLELLGKLKGCRYRFITPTPLTHARVLARNPGRRAMSLAGVFGWNLPFEPAALDPEILAAMQAADLLRGEADGLLRSSVRVSSIGDELFLHSAYPTQAADAVFFGPDTYRYCSFLGHALAAEAGGIARLADIGCGSGAGGLLAGRRLRTAGAQPQILLTDINPAALALARVNAAAAGIAAETLRSDVLRQVPGELDLILSNPPYLNDDDRRAYRHGGGALGFDLSLRIAQEALERLRSGGRLLLYTGVAIVDGADPFLQALRPLLERHCRAFDYGELDPDVFGEELERPCYRQADRIAAVGLVAVRR